MLVNFEDKLFVEQKHVTVIKHKSDLIWGHLVFQLLSSSELRDSHCLLSTQAQSTQRSLAMVEISPSSIWFNEFDYGRYTYYRDVVRNFNPRVLL